MNMNIKKIKKKTYVFFVALIIVLGFFISRAIKFYRQNPDSEYCVNKEGSFKMSKIEAIKIANNSECMKEGKLFLLGEFECNEYTGTWWIVLNTKTKHPGCLPACVVNVVDKSASINWRCTGSLPNR